MTIIFLTEAMLGISLFHPTYNSLFTALLSFPEIGDVPDYPLAAQKRKAMVPWHYLEFNFL